MSLYIDLEKSQLDKGKLVKRQVLVNMANGKTFTRMQWVDPNGDVVVGEHPVPNKEKGEKDTDLAHNAAESILLSHRKRSIQQLVNDNSYVARRIAQHHIDVGLSEPYNVRTATKAELQKKLLQNANYIPMSYFRREDNLRTTSPELAEKVHYADLAYAEKRKIEEPDPKEVVPAYHPDVVKTDEMLGKVGQLDVHEISSGIPIEEEMHSFFDGMSDSTKSRFKSIFKDSTKSGIEHVFSNPEKGYNCILKKIQNGVGSPPGLEGNYGAMFTLHLHIQDNNGNRIATLRRTAGMTKAGHIVVMNHDLQLSAIGKGSPQFLQDLNTRSEQYWKYNSSGNPVRIQSYPVDTFADNFTFAKNGYDFSTEDGFHRQLVPFQVFRAANETPNRSDLKTENDKASMVDPFSFKHSWDFADADNGERYSYPNILSPNGKKFYSSQTPYLDTMQNITLGKAFMVFDSRQYLGYKVLNADHPTERVGEEYVKSLGKE